jgi:hypothetical protein
MEYAVLKYNGKIYRIAKQPFETEEQAMDRVWYIVNNKNKIESFNELVLESLQWMYEKYYKVKY